MATPKTSSTDERWHHPGGKLLRAGPESLTEAELLAIVISAGTAKNPAEKIGAELNNRFQSFRGIVAQPLKELMIVDGLGKIKLCRIAAAHEIVILLANEILPDPVR